jgi:hypothetical protein
MRRYVTWAFTLLLLGATGPTFGGGAKKPAARPNEVEVRFGDGSKVRMQLLQESLEIVTKYGKLVVPTDDVRGIDFGVHLPDGVEEQIKAAIGRLGSTSFKERDAAMNELIKLGGYAYPALKAAEKSSELEVARRVADAIKQIEAKVPADLLRVTSNDRVVTTTFPISGRIVSPSLKAKTPIFGDLALKLPELRSIRWTSGTHEAEVAVDAAKYANNATWLDTGVTLDGQSGVLITASGEVDLLNDGSGEFICGPGGTRNIGGRRIGNRLPGALIGRIGEKGTPFTVGERYHATSAPAGKLYLQIVPPPFNNGQMPSGAFKAVIRSGFFLDGQ